jgi:hypothetical protein
VKPTTWFIFSLLLAVSCLDEPDCYQLNNNKIGIAFRVMGSSLLDTLALVSVDVEGIRFSDFDSVLATGGDFQLNFFQDNTGFIFTRPGRTDSLKLGYRVQPQFVSEDCGSRYLLSELQSLENTFDSVRIVSKTPSRSGGRHVEIFRCPKPDTIAIAFRQLTTAGTTTLSSNFIGVDFNGITRDDGVVLYENKRATTVKLPVMLDVGATKYTLDLKDTVRYPEPRQLSITYDITTEQRYTPCGTQSFVTNLALASSDFDSVSIVRDANLIQKRTLEDPITTNLQIYRFPDTNLLQISFRKPLLTGTIPPQDTVDIASIRTDYSEDIFYADSAGVLSVQLPLNPLATTTTFYLDYADETPTDTVALSYVTELRNFSQNQKTLTFFSQLTKQGEAANIKVTRTSVPYPPVTNIEITH